MPLVISQLFPSAKSFKPLWANHESNGDGMEPMAFWHKSEAVVQFVAVGSQNTHNHIRVTVNVFGDGVHNDIGTVFQWIGYVWRQKGVVDSQQDLGAGLGLVVLQDTGNLGNVSDGQSWVRWGF